MKKFVFSAIAMMAFSVSSMANTIEKIDDSTLESSVLTEDCFDQAIAFMEFLDAFSNYTFNDIQNTHNLNVGVAIFCYGQGTISLAYTVRR